MPQGDATMESGARHPIKGATGKLLTVVLLMALVHVAHSQEFCSSRWNTYGKAVIDIDEPVGFNIVRSLNLFFCQPRGVSIQLWRPLGDVNFALVWSYDVEPPEQVPGNKLVTLDLGSSVFVSPLDRMGLAPWDRQSLPVAMNFFPFNQGSVIASIPDVDVTPPRVADRFSFIELLYPYKFQAAVCGTSGVCELPDIRRTTRPLLNETDGDGGIDIPGIGGEGQIGPQGPQGDQGEVGLKGPQGPLGDEGEVGPQGPDGQDGGTGVSGVKGLLGDPGPRGPPGTSGPRGPEGPPGLKGPSVGGGVRRTGASSSQGECDCGGGLQSSDIILGMLVWALLLTILIIVLLALGTRKPKKA